MSLLSFFGRRILSGAAARVLVNFLMKRFKLSPAVANLISVVLMEALAHQAEKSLNGSGKPTFGKKPSTGKR